MHFIRHGPYAAESCFSCCVWTCNSSVFRVRFVTAQGMLPDQSDHRSRSKMLAWELGTGSASTGVESNCRPVIFVSDLGAPFGNFHLARVDRWTRAPTG